MKRSVLLSVMIIGAVAAFIASAGTFAAFTGSDSDDGDITAAGALSIAVDGVGGDLDFEWDVGLDCDAITPGTTCSALVNVVNNSGYPVELEAPTALVTSGLLDTCDGGVHNLEFFFESYSPDAILVDVADTASFMVHAVLDDVGDDCQGTSATVEVTVPAHSLPLN
jgi:hypothetical protein